MPIVAALARTIDFLIILRSPADCGYLALITIDEPSGLFLFLERVLETADSVLDLAFDLVGLAVSLQLGIACCLTDGLLDRALDLFRRSRDPILVHDCIFLLLIYVPCISRRYNKGGAAAVDSATTHIPPPGRHCFCVSLWFFGVWSRQRHRARASGPSRLVN